MGEMTLTEKCQGSIIVFSGMGYERLVEEMGVNLVDGIPPNGWWGCYDPDTHTILRLKTLAPLQKRSSTYHELGHAYFRHVGCNPRQECKPACGQQGK